MKNIKFPIKFTSLNIFKTDKNKITNTIAKNNILKKEDVKKKFVVIKVEYANLNYKDFLISKGHSGLIKKFPHTPGIDASGTIYFSNSKVCLLFSVLIWPNQIAYYFSKFKKSFSFIILTFKLWAFLYLDPGSSPATT